MIDSAQALYRKLERTFQRHRAYGDCQVDWVFDFCVTAWSLVDWRKHELRLQARLDEVQADVKRRCPALAVCEQVANGAKHLVLNNPALQGFDVTRDVSQNIGRVGYTTVTATESPDWEAGTITIDLSKIAWRPAVQIRDRSGQTWDAFRLCMGVLHFWSNELGVQPDLDLEP